MVHGWTVNCSPFPFISFAAAFLSFTALSPAFLPFGAQILLAFIPNNVAMYLLLDPFLWTRSVLLLPPRSEHAQQFV